MTKRSTEVRGFIKRIPLDVVQKLDSKAQLIERHPKKGVVGFHESLLDHTTRLITQAQSIANVSPHLCQHIHMPAVGAMLYFHEGGKLGLNKRESADHQTLERKIRKAREHKYFDERIAEGMPKTLDMRRRTRQYYLRYNENKPKDTEALFAHFIDKRDIALISVIHFENPLRFDTGNDATTHIKHLKEMLQPVDQLLKLLPPRAREELLLQVAEIKGEFMRAGYGLNRRVMDIFTQYERDLSAKRQDYKQVNSS